MQGIGLAGNLTDAPVISITTAGRTVARFTLAIDDGYRNSAGEWTKRTTVFQRVETWNDAEAARGWAKGSLVLVVGQLRADTYETDGEPRRAQWFAADAAAVVPRARPSTVERGTNADVDADDPFHGAK